MSINSFLSKDQLGLFVIDVQEKLFPFIDRGQDILKIIHAAIQLSKILSLPRIVSEQYPEGLGPTLFPLKDLLVDQKIFSKTTFSGGCDSLILHEMKALGVKEWVLVGIETHICVLQTAKDLMLRGFNVIVLADGTSSRQSFHYHHALDELRALGVRVTTFETVVYELLRDSKDPLFKEVLSLIKQL